MELNILNKEMITQDHIDRIVQIIVLNYQPQKIILFGSYSTGNYNENSDIDLLVLKDTNLPTSYHARKLLSNLNIPVDIIFKTTQEFEMYKNIIGTINYPANKYGKILYEERRNN